MLRRALQWLRARLPGAEARANREYADWRQRIMEEEVAESRLLDFQMRMEGEGLRPLLPAVTHRKEECEHCERSDMPTQRLHTDDGVVCLCAQCAEKSWEDFHKWMGSHCPVCGAPVEPDPTGQALVVCDACSKELDSAPVYRGTPGMGPNLGEGPDNELIYPI